MRQFSSIPSLPNLFGSLRQVAWFVYLAIFSGTAFGELIPPARMTNWEPGVRVGVPGGIPTNRTNLINVVTVYGADNTGATDAAPKIQAAINAAAPGDVVYLPAGTYRINATLYFGGNRDNITLRGAGMGSTTIDTRGSTAAILIGVASDYNWAYPSTGNVVTGGLVKDGRTLSIQDASPFTVGQIVRIAIENENDDARIRAGAAPVVSVSGFKNLRLQVARIVGKTSNSLEIFPPLYDSYGAGTLAVKVNAAQMQTDGVGIEDLTIECGNGPAVYGIEFEQAYACWAKNVKVRRSQNYGFFLYDSLQCEIRKCFADQRATEGSNGAGVLCNSSSACLIEDSIAYKFFPIIEVNQGSSGNVFAYNVFEDPRVFGGLGGGLNSNHGPHNSFNLYEGNITPSVQADGYFGSASDDTFFRNWIHGTLYDGSLKGFIIGLNRFTRNYSFVGNILGTGNTTLSTPYSFGNPNMGNSSFSGTAQPTAGDFWAEWTTIKNAAPGTGPGPAGFQEKDLDVQASTILKGNYHYLARVIPPEENLGSDTMPVSLFRNSKPAWFGDRPWPPFNSLNPGIPSYEQIPAGYRFVHGTEPPGMGGDEIKPSDPQNAVATAQSSSQISITWTTSSDNVGVTGYLVERAQGAGSTTYSPVGSASLGSFTDSGLQPATVYNYRVRATDAAGNLSGYSNVASATTAGTTPDTTAPTVPVNVTATAVGSNQINVNWTASSDNVGVVGYRVERAQASPTNFVQIAAPASAGLSDTGLSPATLYNYRVRAVDAAGNLSGYSITVTATTMASPDTTPPTAPQSLTATVIGATQANLNWTASTDNVGVASYRIERSQGLGSTAFTEVATSGEPFASDSSLVASTIYNYRVRATDAAGNNSGYSPIATVTTGAPSTVGLVAAYGFDETIGAIVSDASGNGNAGTISGATRVATGRFGAALQFDGVDDVVLVNPSASLNLNSAMTLEAWVYPTTAQSGWRAILHKETDAWYLHTGHPDAAMHPAGGGVINGQERFAGSNTALPLDTWSHVATTYDGATIRTYVNGVEMGAQAATGSIEVNANALRIGGNTYPNQFFAGLIDEIRIYNRALSVNELQGDMNARVKAPKPPTGLRVIGQ